jgi:hypothetical protein
MGANDQPISFEKAAITEDARIDEARQEEPEAMPDSKTNSESLSKPEFDESADTIPYNDA